MGRIGLRSKLPGMGISKGSFKRMVEVNQGYNRYINGLEKKGYNIIFSNKSIKKVKKGAKK